MRDAASQTCFRGSERDVRDSEGVRGRSLQGDFWYRIRLWKAVAKGITGSRCQPARGPVGGERTAYCLPARAPVGGHRTAGSQTSFTDSESADVGCLHLQRWSDVRACGEDLFRAIFGVEFDCRKLWRRESLGAGVSQAEDPWEVRERLIVHQPEQAVAKGITGSRCQPARAPVEVRVHRLLLRIPKATLDIHEGVRGEPL